MGDLKRDRNIIIKKADKGVAMVIMNEVYYKDKIEEQLQNRHRYRAMQTGNQ